MPKPKNYPRTVFITVIACVVGVGFTTLILTSSLTDVAKGLDTSERTLAWVVTGPFLVAGVGTSTFGRVGDTYGHRRVFLFGVSIYLVSTLLSALSWNVGSLIAFRLLSGVGTAASQPNGSALIMQQYHGADRNRVIGWYQMSLAMSPVVGAIAGGPLIEHLGWRTVFLLLAPVTTGGLIAAVVFIRPSQPGQRVPLDGWGATALGLGVFGLLFGVDRAGKLGLVRPLPIVLFAAGVCSLWLFVLIEQRVAHPMLKLHYFRNRSFGAAIATGMLANIPLFGTTVVLPIMLRTEFNKKLSQIVWLVVWRPLAYSFGSGAGGALSARTTNRLAARLGTFITFIGALLLIAAAREHSIPIMILAIVLTGGGVGLAAPGLAATVVGIADASDLGVASGALATSQLIGQVIGIELLVNVTGTKPVSSDFARAFTVGAVVALMAFFMAGFVGLRRRSRSTLELAKTAVSS